MRVLLKGWDKIRIGIEVFNKNGRSFVIKICQSLEKMGGANDYY